MEYTSPPHPPSFYGFTSATPSPSGGPHGFYQRPGMSPRHSRHASGDFGFSSPPRGFPSPRYSSTGYYSTRAGYTSPSGEAEFVSAKRRGPRGHRGYSWSSPMPPPKPTRRYSQSYRASHGESDDDEYFVYEGHVYIVPG